jgi:flagellar biosynthesis/type III secretory pathway chaperone
VICFKIRKLSGYIFHLHLVTKFDNVERSVVIVKLLRLNYSILQDHTYLGQLWSELTVWNTRCPSANQNNTAVLIVVLLAERASRGYLLTVTLVRQLSSTEHVFCTDVVLATRQC